MKLIIDIPKDDYELVQKYIYPQRIFYEVTHGTPIPDNATNGDVLDKISAEIEQKQYDFMSDGDYDEGIRFGLMLSCQIIDKYKGDKE